MSCFLQHKESLKNVISDMVNLQITNDRREIIDMAKFDAYENKLKAISRKLGFDFETMIEKKEEVVSKFAGRDPKKTRGDEKITIYRAEPINSIFLEIDEARKKLGIYDTKETTNSFFKRLDVAKENNGQISMFYQLNGATRLGPAIEELDRHLLDFISQFGVRSKEFEDLKSRLGVDALGATDVLNKLIWYKTKRNEETIPEEVGHMAVMLMGEKDPIVKTLLKNIELWSEYAEIKEKYLPIYKNEKQVKIEAIGKLIAKALVKNYKAHGLNHTILEKIILKIEEIIRKIIQSTGIGNAMILNERIADHVALNILMGNKSYIADVVEGTKQLNYQKAMLENPFVANTITLFTSKGAHLSGSLALAGQGLNVYREKIKDIDFKVDSIDDYNNLEQVLKSINAVPKHFGWSFKNKGYACFAYVIPRPGHRIEVIKRDKYRGNGYLEEYKVYNQYGNEIDKSIGTIEVDFFVSKYPVDGGDKIFTPWEDIMSGKLSLSPLGDGERMFQRNKDQEDYIVMKPSTYAKSSSAFIYYQLNEQETEEAATLKDLNTELINGFLADFGITATEYASMKEDLGIDSYTASDILTKAIAYQEGESILPEVAYFAFSMLGKNNNKIVSDLRFLIGKWKGYRARFKYHKEVIYQKRGIIPDTKEWRRVINDLCILDFIKENIEDYYKNPKKFEKVRDSRWTKEDFSLWNKLIRFIEKTLAKFSLYFRQAEKKQHLSDLGLSIADDILSRNYTYYDYSLSADSILKNYVDTINSDLFAKKIVEVGQKLKLVLTGSLALRKAGTVYRTVLENIHDIDWVIPYQRSISTNEDIAVYNKIRASQKQAFIKMNNAILKATKQSIKQANEKEVAEMVKGFSWYNDFTKEFPTFKLINGFYGGEHINGESITVQGVIDGEFYESNGKHEKTVEYYTKDPLTKAPVKQSKVVKVSHKKGDLIEGTGYAIDFFVRLTESQEEHENYFKLWKEITIAKLKMGRDKDFRDWKAFIPFVQSQGAYNFNYAGFRHFNYESSQLNMFDDVNGAPKQKTINNKYYFDNQENLHNFEDDSQSNFFC